jgi:hypothetical protein
MKQINTNLDNGAPVFNGVPNAMNLTVLASNYHHMHSVWGI